MNCEKQIILTIVLPAPCTGGHQVDASKVAQALYPLVAAEQQADSKGVERVREGGLSVEARALTAFRELYRDTWSNPQVSFCSLQYLGCVEPPPHAPVNRQRRVVTETTGNLQDEINQAPGTGGLCLLRCGGYLSAFVCFTSLCATKSASIFCT